MAPQSVAKPLTQRPFDLVYYTYFLVHLLITVFIDCLALWPKVAQTVPVWSHVYWYCKGLIDDYTKKSNDPFMLASWGLTLREYEFAHMRVFMWIELLFLVPTFIIGMRGLVKNTPAIYPLLLAYASCALVTTITVAHDTYALPSATTPNLDPVSQYYALSDFGRSYISQLIIPFLLIPAVMWVDMMYRLGKLVSLGAKVEAQRGLVANGKGKGSKDN